VTYVHILYGFGLCALWLHAVGHIWIVWSKYQTIKMYLTACVTRSVIARGRSYLNCFVIKGSKLQYDFFISKILNLKSKLSDQYQTVKMYLTAWYTRFVIGPHPTQFLLLYSCKRWKKEDKKLQFTVYKKDMKHDLQIHYSVINDSPSSTHKFITNWTVNNSHKLKPFSYCCYY